MEADVLEREINEMLDAAGISYHQRLYNKVNRTINWCVFDSIAYLPPNISGYLMEHGVIRVKLEPSKDDVGYLKISDIEFKNQ